MPFQAVVGIVHEGEPVSEGDVFEADYGSPAVQAALDAGLIVPHKIEKSDRPKPKQSSRRMTTETTER